MFEYMFNQIIISSVFISILVLGILSVNDIKTKQLKLPIIIIVCIYGVINQVLCSSSIKSIIIEIFITVSITLVLLFVSFITKEQLGMGDGFVFLMLGLVNHWQMAITTYIIAFILAGIVGLFIIAIKRHSRKIALPFVPFVTVTYLVLTLVR